ncbi:MAG: hypothetical protein ACR2QH_14250 [Geminicoccaceae bacterium]
MPIKPALRWYYPIDWPELSASVRFDRAGGRCEQCRRPHGRIIHHLGDGRWFDSEDEIWRDGEGRAVEWIDHRDYGGELQRTKVVLATAHLDHNPENNRPGNLKALCQRCHLRHDRKEHRRRARITIRKRRALGDLLDGPYPD